MTTKNKSAEQIEAMIQWRNDPSTHGMISRVVESEVELEIYLVAAADQVDEAA